MKIRSITLVKLINNIDEENLQILVFNIVQMSIV
jgi:hypothetical protein